MKYSESQIRSWIIESPFFNNFCSSEIHIDFIKHHSRNTIVFRFKIDSQTYFGKINIYHADKLCSEFNHLYECYFLNRNLFIQPISLNIKRGIMITRYCPGTKFNDILFYNRKDNNELYRQVYNAANALYSYDYMFLNQS